MTTHVRAASEDLVDLGQALRKKDLNTASFLLDSGEKGKAPSSLRQASRKALLLADGFLISANSGSLGREITVATLCTTSTSFIATQTRRSWAWGAELHASQQGEFRSADERRLGGERRSCGARLGADSRKRTPSSSARERGDRAQGGGEVRGGAGMRSLGETRSLAWRARLLPFRSLPLFVERRRALDLLAAVRH